MMARQGSGGRDLRDSEVGARGRNVDQAFRFSQEAMRKLAKLCLGHGDDDLACVAKVARQVAKTRTSEVNKMDAENEAKTILSNDLAGMKEAFEKQLRPEKAR